MFSKKTMRIICIVIAVAMFIPVCLSVVAMLTGMI